MIQVYYCPHIVDDNFLHRFKSNLLMCKSMQTKGKICAKVVNGCENSAFSTFAPVLPLVCTLLHIWRKSISRLVEVFIPNLNVLNLGKINLAALKLKFIMFTVNKSERYFRTSLFLTLNIKLLYFEDPRYIFEFSFSILLTTVDCSWNFSHYEVPPPLFLQLNWIFPNFITLLLSDFLQKCHVNRQYVR